MATKTSLLGLTKPAYTEAADIAVLNENFDLIDRAIVEGTWTESLTDNSDFQIWQRGTTFENVPVLQYHADRWRGSGNVIRSYTKVHNGCRVTAQNSATYMGITQMIPAEKLEPGQYTLVWEFTPSASCKTYSGTAVAAGVRTKEAVAISITTSDINAGSRAAETGIMCMADGSPISVGFYIDVHYMDCYKGTYTTATAPLHHRRGYAAELAECRRYYQCLLSPDFMLATLGEGLAFTIHHSGMRITPSVAVKNPATGSTNTITSQVNGGEFAVTFTYGTKNVTSVMVPTGSVGHTYGVSYEVSADL